MTTTEPIPSTPKSIQAITTEGYHVKSLEYLREGWATFKNYPTGFLGFAMLFTVASQAALTLGRVVGQVVSLVIQVIMLAGIAMVVWKEIQRGPTRFTDFFPDWNTAGYLMICTILGLLLVVTGLILFVVPGIYLMVAYMFSNMLIVDRKFTPWQALEASRRVVTRNWWGVAGLTGVMMALMFGGAAVGILVLGLPLGAVLNVYYPDVSLSDLPFGPADSTVVVNMGRMIGIVSGAMLGLGLGTALAGCMLGIAYADIFGLSATRDHGPEPVAEKMSTVAS
jgi:hypothetical protein